MSVLASLVHAYDRLAEGRKAPEFGYARTNISFVIILDLDGNPTCMPVDIREPQGKKQNLVGKRLDVPTFLTQRTSGIAPNFLWDKTSYSLGVIEEDLKKPVAKQAKEVSRTLETHAAFVDLHTNLLSETTDKGLRAFIQFLRVWKPEEFEKRGWPGELKGENVVFSLDGDVGRRYIHERPAARELWTKLLASEPSPDAVCLISGAHSRIHSSHPPIKGVDNAQSSGAFIVSFNQPAFVSYGHESAPVSEAAAFAYTTALNHFLERDSGHRVQIGDASTVFWADASDAAAAVDAEDIFASLLGVDENVEAKKVGVILDAIRQGRPIAELKPELPKDVRFYVLGLSPNAARLSVRFFIEDDFGEIASHYLAHVERMRLDPPPREDAPSIWRLLIETASQRKSENIPPNLAGEWLRAILTGAPYPLTLLSALLMRLRADHDINARRAAILKSVLIRNFEMEVPLSLDPMNDDPGYLLGRLFAVLEKTQTLAQGRVNASIKDRYYGAASATPRTVFPLLLRLNVHHQGKAEGKSKGLAGYFAQQLSEIMNKLPTEFPATLNLRRQGTFALGYFHQINWRKNAETSEPATTIQE